MAKINSKLPESPAPLNTYGLPFDSTKSQTFYDMAAFAHRVSIDKGAPPRLKLFKKFTDVLLPNHFEWHEWTERFLRPLCPDEKKQSILVGYSGCSNCVAGHTRILNPITGEQPTIQELYEKQIAPMVMTLQGAIQADVPYVKGIAEIFEIKLANGTKFSATANHRVCVSAANPIAPKFCRVSDLRTSQLLPAYEPIRQRSTLDTFPSSPAPSVRRSRKKVEGSRQNYYHDSRLCGEQPHSAITSDQYDVLPQSDVQEHSHNDCGLDDSVTTNKCNRDSLKCVHPSNSDALNPHNILGIRGLPLLCQETLALAYHWCERFWRFLSKSKSLLPSSKPIRDSVNIYSYKYKIARTAIVSIRKTGKEVFYDLGVPKAHHYFAEGTVHHNSAKSFNAASFACAWWLAWPEESSVTFVSTTMKALRRRGWSEVQKCFSGMSGERFGNFIDSRMVWQSVRGDDKHAIIGKAVEEGSTQKVADDIKGVHTLRQMFIIDEATSIPEAIFAACNNMYSYPDEFIMMVLGNPYSRLDQHGLFCEPDKGWNTVTVETGEWEAKPFASCGNTRPYVVTFDAEKSPNITEGKIVSRHLPKKEEVQAGFIAAGQGQTPLWWSNKRGFWPPEGLVKTVFTESMLSKFDGYGKHKFQNAAYSIIGGFDPAFGGGDNPCLRFGKIGTLEGGGWGIEVLEPIILNITANDKDNPAHYQLTKKLRDNCEKVSIDGHETSCPPDRLGVDDTGEGGLCDILYREWSHHVQRIEFNGAASEEPVSLEDTRPAHDFCKNKRTEMFLYARAALQSGQLKGIDRETAKEMCSIEVDDSKPKVIIESKVDYRATHGGHSPDRSDSLVILLEVARRKGFTLNAVGQTAIVSEDWNKEVRQSQEIYLPENTWQPEEFLEPESELVL